MNFAEKKFEGYTKEEREFINNKAEWLSFWDLFGIELNVFEQIAFHTYPNSFEKSNLTYTPDTDARHFFMLDYFGLDDIECGRMDMPCHPHYGMNFLGDERFKEYCRRNVDFWREERRLENLELRR